MASEIEASAERYRRWRECKNMREEMKHEYWDDHELQLVDEAALFDWASTRLAADRAEREKRERPIDAAWCKANGAWGVGDSTVWRWVIGNLYVDWDDHNGVTITGRFRGGRTFLGGVKTCGAFGDLLRVLKGGALGTSPANLPPPLPGDEWKDS